MMRFNWVSVESEKPKEGVEVFTKLEEPDRCLFRTLRYVKSQWWSLTEEGGRTKPPTHWNKI